MKDTQNKTAKCCPRCGAYGNHLCSPGAIVHIGARGASGPASGASGSNKLASGAGGSTGGYESESGWGTSSRIYPTDSEWERCEICQFELRPNAPFYGGHQKDCPKARTAKCDYLYCHGESVNCVPDCSCKRNGHKPHTKNDSEVSSKESLIEQIIEDVFNEGHIAIPEGLKWLRTKLNEVYSIGAQQFRERVLNGLPQFADFHLTAKQVRFFIENLDTSDKPEMTERDLDFNGPIEYPHHRDQLDAG